MVKQVNIAGTAADNAEGASGFLSGAAGSGGVANKVGPTNVSLAGEIWVQESGDWTTSHGTTVHAVVLVATHSDSTYLIAYVATASTFSAAKTRYFQSILQSFTFL